jgi:hypothetical protein
MPRYTTWKNLKKRSLLLGPRCDWEDNIKRYFKEIRSNGVDWSYLAPDWVFCAILGFPGYKKDSSKKSSLRNVDGSAPLN